MTLSKTTLCGLRNYYSYYINNDLLESQYFNKLFSQKIIFRYVPAFLLCFDNLLVIFVVVKQWFAGRLGIVGIGVGGVYW